MTYFRKGDQCEWVGAWNARRFPFITDREIRDEYIVPSFDIVDKTRTSGTGNTSSEKGGNNKNSRRLTRTRVIEVHNRAHVFNVAIYFVYTIRGLH